MRVTLLHNPEAGDDSLDEKELRFLLKSSGYAATYRSTKAKGWRKSLDDPGAMVVVAGGDGTVAKVARRLAGRGVPMALLPGGTANNIAHSLGLNADPATLVAQWPTARATPVDLGLIDGTAGERCFIEACGLGVFPHLMTESKRRISKDTMPARKQIPLNIDLMIELLEEAHPISCGVIADGRDLSGSYLILELMNIRSIGPRIDFGPKADPTDGLLDIVAIRDEERHVTLDFLRRCRDKVSGPLELPRVVARTVQLDWHRDPLHIDDECWPDDDEARTHENGAFSASVTVLSGAIEILL